MPNDKILSREEFRELQRRSGEEMAADADLRKDSLDLLFKADQHRWIHQSTWFGEPVLNLAQDMFALQEIIFQTRPEFIIEVGVAWGGSLLFYSTLLEVLGGGEIIGVDIFIPDDLKERLQSHGRLYDRIHLLEGSSIEQETVDRVTAITGGSKKTMILLDSNHTHDHVYRELQLYSPMVAKDFYLICGDTIVEDIPEQEHRERPWGPGNNPKTALNAFMQESDRFEVDTALENKLLFSCNPGGYLRCVKD